MAVGQFTEQEKIAAVHLYLSDHYSYADISRKLGVDKRVIRLWVARFRRHGKGALAPRKGCSAFDPAFKMEVLNYHWKNRASYFETAVEFNLAAPSTVQKWEDQALLHDLRTLFPVKKGRPPMKKKPPEDMSTKEMQKELEELRMENAYLKKLKALVQEKQSSQKKTGRGRSTN